MAALLKVGRYFFFPDVARVGRLIGQLTAATMAALLSSVTTFCAHEARVGRMVESAQVTLGFLQLKMVY